MFSNLFSITLPNIKKYFPGIHFPKRNYFPANKRGFKENTFLETKLNFSLTVKCFPLTGKCFLLTNFSNGKQTQESLETGFPETIFRETNTP
jgi:hypothetical protein